MKPKLPRALLWRDKKSMDEMLKEPFADQLYHMFIIMSRSMRMRYSGIYFLPILNEVYYQCTRVTYEKDADASVKKYTEDIKANIGGLRDTTKLILRLMTYLLMAQSDRSDEVMTFIKRLKFYFKTPNQSYLDLGEEECFLSSFIKGMVDEGFFLVPEPCSADDLESMVIDWQEVTRGYSKQMINEVIMIWHDGREQSKVLKKIKNAFHKRVLSLFENEPEDVADEMFFLMHNDESEAEEEEPVCEFCGEAISYGVENSEQIAELEQKILRLEKRNNELETENVRLKSELNNRKQKSKQVRAFTLSMIVDYCKNRVDYQQVAEIVNMLYKFLRGSGTDAEYESVDGIEEEFKKRAGGMNIAHADVAVGIAEKDSQVYHHVK